MSTNHSGGQAPCPAADDNSGVLCLIVLCQRFWLVCSPYGSLCIPYFFPVLCFYALSLCVNVGVSAAMPLVLLCGSLSSIHFVLFSFVLYDFDYLTLFYFTFVLLLDTCLFSIKREKERVWVWMGG